MEPHDVSLLATLGNALFAQQRNSQFCDLTLENDSFSLDVHGCVMAARSRLLASALLPETITFSEDGNGEKSAEAPPPRKKFRLDDDVDKNALMMLLEIAYTGRLTRFIDDGNNDADGMATTTTITSNVIAVSMERKCALARRVGDLADRLDMPEALELCDKLTKRKARGRPKGKCKDPLDEPRECQPVMRPETELAETTKRVENPMKTRRSTRLPAKYNDSLLSKNGAITDEIAAEEDDGDHRIKPDDLRPETGALDGDFYPYKKTSTSVTSRKRGSRPASNEDSITATTSLAPFSKRRRKLPLSLRDFQTKSLSDAFDFGDDDDDDDDVRKSENDDDDDDDEIPDEKNVDERVSLLFASVVEKLKRRENGETEDESKNKSESINSVVEGEIKEDAKKLVTSEGEDFKSIKDRLVPPTEADLLDWKNCKYCSKFRGKKKGSFEFHVNYCRKAVAFCRKCKKPSLTREEADAHACAQMERPTCPKCGKTFSEKSALHEHNKIHLDLRKFACKQCPKKFLRSAHLRGHVMHVHTKERSFKCEKCDLGFPMRYELTRHLRKHDAATAAPASMSNAAFPCGRCGASFASQKLLNRHSVAAHRNEIAALAEVERRKSILSKFGAGKSWRTAPVRILPMPGVEHSYVRILPGIDGDADVNATSGDDNTVQFNSAHDAGDVRYQVVTDDGDGSVTYLDIDGATLKLLDQSGAAIISGD